MKPNTTLWRGGGGGGRAHDMTIDGQKHMELALFASWSNRTATMAHGILIKRKFLFDFGDLRLIFGVCVQTQVLCNGPGDA